MSKEFVRNIRNTTTSEPLTTNEQNDILSDTDNVYIRNKNSYYPLTKSILEIKAIDTIVSVAHNIDGTDKNNVVLTTNEEKLKEYIQKHTQTPDIEITPEEISNLIEVKNGLVKNLTETSLEIYPRKDLDNLGIEVNTNSSDIGLLKTKTQTLENRLNVKILDMNSNYDDLYQTIEDETNTLHVLRYQDQLYYKTGKSNTRYYFFNINKKTQTGFIDYEVIELSRTNANLIITNLTPSEVKTI